MWEDIPGSGNTHAKQRGSQQGVFGKYKVAVQCPWYTGYYGKWLGMRMQRKLSQGLYAVFRSLVFSLLGSNNLIGFVLERSFWEWS